MAGARTLSFNPAKPCPAFQEPQTRPWEASDLVASDPQTHVEGAWRLRSGSTSSSGLKIPAQAAWLRSVCLRPQTHATSGHTTDREAGRQVAGVAGVWREHSSGHFAPRWAPGSRASLRPAASSLWGEKEGESERGWGPDARPRAQASSTLARGRSPPSPGPYSSWAAGQRGRLSGGQRSPQSAMSCSSRGPRQGPARPLGLQLSE